VPDNLAFLFAAFAVVWLLVFGYLLFLGGRIGGLRQEVEALRDELDARAPAVGGARASSSSRSASTSWRSPPIRPPRKSR
jgi:CcmD family protein